MNNYWYDRKGKLLINADFDKDYPKWVRQMDKVEKLLSDPQYQKVKQQETPRKTYWVSTVWLGLNQRFGRGKPLIFETMVFSRNIRGKDKSVDQKRYTTEKEALDGHKALFQEYARKERQNVDPLH